NRGHQRMLVRAQERPPRKSFSSPRPPAYCTLRSCARAVTRPARAAIATMPVFLCIRAPPSGCRPLAGIRIRPLSSQSIAGGERFDLGVLLGCRALAIGGALGVLPLGLTGSGLRLRLIVDRRRRLDLGHRDEDATTGDR